MEEPRNPDSYRDAKTQRSANYNFIEEIILATLLWSCPENLNIIYSICNKSK